MSIFPLFLLWGVAICRHISYYDDDTVLQPIMSRSQERRFCAELCMAGLGGTPCGEDCVDITPQGLPIQLSTKNSTKNVYSGANSRQSACPLLCENQLGFPLCKCEDDDGAKKSRADFVQICGFYCVNFDYQIYGCQQCDVYKKLIHDHATVIGRNIVTVKTEINWDKWCQTMCQQGEGGAACNCDLLPMDIHSK